MKNWSLIREQAPTSESLILSYDSILKVKNDKNGLKIWSFDHYSIQISIIKFSKLGKLEIIKNVGTWWNCKSFIFPSKEFPSTYNHKDVTLKWTEIDVQTPK